MKTSDIPYTGHLERGPDRIYNGPAIRLDLAGYGGAVELGFVGCTMAERPDDYAAFIVEACNNHAALVVALEIAATTLETVYRERDPKNIAAKCAAERARKALANLTP